MWSSVFVDSVNMALWCRNILIMNCVLWFVIYCILLCVFVGQCIEFLCNCYDAWLSWQITFGTYTTFPSMYDNAGSTQQETSYSDSVPYPKILRQKAAAPSSTQPVKPLTQQLPLCHLKGQFSCEKEIEHFSVRDHQSFLVHSKERDRWRCLEECRTFEKWDNTI
jgi:hypothetical protein